MLKILITIAILSSWMNAATLTFIEGTIKAHTEVFGDSTIDPFTTQISSHLTIGSNPTQLSGDISIPSITLHSENEGRDDHMHEAIHAESEKVISIEVTKVKKTNDLYQIYADLTLNGVTKQIVSVCNIQEKGTKIDLDGNFSIQMSDYKIEQPSMLFFTVRNQVDIKYTLKYEK